MIFMFRMVLELFRGKWLLTGAVLLCLLLMSLDGIVFPYFLGQFTNILTAGEFNKLPLLFLVWLLLWLVILLAGFLNSFFFGKVRRGINIELKDRVFRKSFWPGNERAAPSKYMATITSDIRQIERNIVDNSMSFLYSILQGGITLVFLLLLHWKVGLVFILLGFLPSLVPLLTSSWLKRGTEDWQQANQAYIGELEDGLHGRRLLKRYGAVAFFFKQILSSLSREQDKYFTMNLRQRASAFFVSSLYVISTILALAYGSYVVLQGDLTVGMLLTVMTAADRVVTPLISLANLYNEMIATEPLLRKILRDAGEEKKTKAPLYLAGDSPLILLEDVSIGYDQGRPLVEGLNLEIAKGDRILIEGPSGSGKSTLLQTIMNEVDVLKGRIYYANSLRDHLRERFAVVEQEPFIFNNSLKYNLLLAGELSNQKIFDLLKKAGLGDYATEEALNIQLGSEDHQLSGGELKRLEVARALLYGKEILVVDEALSGLDAKNADLLNQLILAYPGTVINIEHRLEKDMRSRFNKRIQLG